MRPNIKRLQEIELRRFNTCLEAEASGDLAAVKASQELWLNASEQLRRAEATNPDVEKSNRESVAIAEVVTEFHKIHSAMRTSIDALPARLTHKLVGLDSAATLTAIQHEMTVLLRHLMEWEDIKREQS